MSRISNRLESTTRIRLTVGSMHKNPQESLEDVIQERQALTQHPYKVRTRRKRKQNEQKSLISFCRSCRDDASHLNSFSSQILDQIPWSECDCVWQFQQPRTWSIANNKQIRTGILDQPEGSLWYLSKKIKEEKIKRRSFSSSLLSTWFLWNFFVRSLISGMMKKKKMTISLAFI